MSPLFVLEQVENGSCLTQSKCGSVHVTLQLTAPDSIRSSRGEVSRRIERLLSIVNSVNFQHNFTNFTLMSNFVIFELHTFYPRDATLARTGISCRPMSVRPSVTSRCSTETAKRRIVQTTPRDSPGTLHYVSKSSYRLTVCSFVKS